MAKKGTAEQTKQNINEHGFWIYEDGVSYWGINIYRNGMVGFETTEEIHKSPLDKKIEWYQATLAQKIAKEAEEDKKAAALKKNE